MIPHGLIVAFIQPTELGSPWLPPGRSSRHTSLFSVVSETLSFYQVLLSARLGPLRLRLAVLFSARLGPLRLRLAVELSARLADAARKSPSSTKNAPARSKLLRQNPSHCPPNRKNAPWFASAKFSVPPPIIDALRQQLKVPPPKKCVSTHACRRPIRIQLPPKGPNRPAPKPPPTE